MILTNSDSSEDVISNTSTQKGLRAHLAEITDAAMEQAVEILNDELLSSGSKRLGH